MEYAHKSKYNTGEDSKHSQGRHLRSFLLDRRVLPGVSSSFVLASVSRWFAGSAIFSDVGAPVRYVSACTCD